MEDVNISHLELLTLVLPDSSPEEKFCIIRLFQLYSDGWFTLPSITEVAKVTGASYTQAKQAIDQLVAHELLSRRSEFIKDVPTHEVGLCLPLKFDSLTEATRSKKLRAKKHNHPITLLSPTKPTLHQHIIEGLLAAAPNDLRAGNKLLLATLLRYANETGAVRNLGMADLGRLLGMRKDRLSSQIQKLKKLGYIRTSFGGITGKHMFGIQNGALFLNLKHPGYERRRKHGITVILQGCTSEIASIRGMAKNFSEAIKSLSATYPGNVPAAAAQTTPIPYIGNAFTPAQFSRMSGFFDDHENIRVIDYYQSKLEECASYILSKKLQALSDLKPLSGQLISSSHILEEVIPLKHQKLLYTGEPYVLPPSVSAIVKATALLAEYMALFVFKRLNQHTLVNWQQMNIDILPPTHIKTKGLALADVIAIECTFKDQVHADQGCWMINKNPEDSYSTYEVDQHTAMSLEFQINNGLREINKESRPFPAKTSTS